MIFNQAKLGILFIVLAMAIIAAIPNLVMAQTTLPTRSSSLAPTVSITPIPSVSEEDIRLSLQDRLKRAAEEKTSEAKKILGATDRTAVSGALKDMANSTLTITLKSGVTKLVATTEQTVVVRKGKSAAAEDLSIGDFVIAMGYLGASDILDARRVVAVEKAAPRLVRQVVLGVVGDVDQKSRSFTLGVKRPVELGDLVYEIAVPKSVTLDFAGLEDKTKLLVVGAPDAKNPRKLTLRVFQQL